ncbi:SDR family oxidoreductase [Pseudomonas sp. Fl5BN2]|uniref:SDR family oxidoreductase n=1 Tax=Pseudomonas sp. Fl5BN2 TaxID=2697652 RepID=UPI003DA7FFEA
MPPASRPLRTRNDQSSLRNCTPFILSRRALTTITQTAKVAIVTGASRGSGAVIARQLARDSQAMAPGPVATELFLQGRSEEQIHNFARMPPPERLGQPEDIASIIAFLASPAAAWVNGQVLRANGALV